MVGSPGRESGLSITWATGSELRAEHLWRHHCASLRVDEPDKCVSSSPSSRCDMKRWGPGVSEETCFLPTDHAWLGGTDLELMENTS